MSEENTKQIVEINGVKLEVDLRYARRIEELKIGSRVKVLIKGYGDDFKSHAGVVVGFEPFPDRPTIIVAYIESGYNSCEMKLLHWHKGIKDNQIIASIDEDFDINKAEVLNYFDLEERKCHDKLAELAAKRRYFLDKFQCFFPDVADITQPRANV